MSLTNRQMDGSISLVWGGIFWFKLFLHCVQMVAITYLLHPLMVLHVVAETPVPKQLVDHALNRVSNSWVQSLLCHHTTLIGVCFPKQGAPMLECNFSLQTRRLANCNYFYGTLIRKSTIVWQLLCNDCFFWLLCYSNSYIPPLGVVLHIGYALTPMWKTTLQEGI